MWFDIGILEVGAIAIALTVTLLLAGFHRRSWKWSMVVLACCTAAACITPADPMSTLLIGSLLLAAFATGVYCSGTLRPISA